MGDITVTNVGVLVTVSYEITEPGWYLTETHTYIGASTPHKNAPGKFPYKSAGLHDITDTETATITSANCYITTHAVVTNENDIIGCEWPTLDEVSGMFLVIGKFTIDYGTESKFVIDVFDDSFVNGTHKAWCIDMDHAIVPSPMVYFGDFFPAMMISH